MKSYIAISVIIFAPVAIVHIMRIAQSWQVQVGETGVRCPYHGSRSGLA